MINWIDFSTTVCGVLGAFGGWEAIKYLLNRKSNKRINDSEADKKEIEADSTEFHLYVERINELRQANVELNKQNLEMLKAGAHKDEIIDDKTDKIRELQEARIADTRKIGQLEKQVQFYKNWHCQRETGKGKEECTRRKPQQNPPLKYTPIEQ